MAGTAADKLAKLSETKAALKTALAEKGQTVGDVFSTYPDAVKAIETGLDTSDATAYAADIRKGKTAYARGVKVSGTIQDYTGGTTVTSNGTLYTAGKYCTKNITVSVSGPELTNVEYADEQYNQSAVRFSKYPIVGFTAAVSGNDSGNLYIISLLHDGSDWVGGGYCHSGTAMGTSVEVMVYGSSSSIEQIYVRGSVNEACTIYCWTALRLPV